MNHLILCREYPPAPIPPGGIGTYVLHLSHLLAERGETVHVIAQRWQGARQPIEMLCDGNLIIHRVAIGAYGDFWLQNPFKAEQEPVAPEVKGLTQSGAIAQAFAWQAGLLAEQLVETEGIDLIEAQEYEAPLYFFQLRRSLGLGPRSTPPCLVHLHSPSEFIFKHNGWNQYHPDFVATKRLEDYSIAAADALLCPSHYLARQAEAHYKLAAGSIQVIPLPIGDNLKLERTAATWADGSICYVGRLERRKGILEWIDAAVTVAKEDPTLKFEFIGQNCLGNYKVNGHDLIKNRIPDPLKSRFIFHGKQNRALLPTFLKQARIAVVPSRWENFPNTCVEAMCSGLPVLASPEGGMAEMIGENETGWISDQFNAASLAATLRRAIATPPETLAAMGAQAAIAIHQLCDNSKIVDQQLTFRQQVVRQSSQRALNRLFKTATAPAVTELERPDDALKQVSLDLHSQVAVIVMGLNQHSVTPCLQSLIQQTCAARVVVVVDSQFAAEQAHLFLQHQPIDWQIVQVQSSDRVAAKTAGIQAMLQQEMMPLGVAFLDAFQPVEVDYIAICQQVLRQCPAVGIVSCWMRSLTNSTIWAKPYPLDFPYQWVTNEAAPVSVFRTEALQAVGGFRAEMSQGYEDWDVVNAILVAGWTAITVPKILATAATEQDSVFTLPSTQSCGNLYELILNRFPDLVQQDATEIAFLTHSMAPRITQEIIYKRQYQLFLFRILLQTAEMTLKNYREQFKLVSTSFLNQTKHKIFQKIIDKKIYVSQTIIRARKKLFNF